MQAYETEADRVAQREIAGECAEKWSAYTIVETPGRFKSYDFVVTRRRTNDVVAICEIKDRPNITWAQMEALGGTLVDVEKVSFLQLFCLSNPGLKSLLIVRDKASEIRFMNVGQLENVTYKFTGRSDRQDDNDIGIKAILPVKLFKKLDGT